MRPMGYYKAWNLYQESQKKEQENGIKNDPKLAIPYIPKPDKDTTKK